jgi:hypothetical protein
VTSRQTAVTSSDLEEYKQMIAEATFLIAGYSPFNGKDLPEARPMSLKRSERKTPVRSSV